nr:sucrase ferredoxin [Actinomycetota bacterium]
MNQEFRCSANSQALAEPLVGTASTVRAFLLLEVPGPWGVDAPRDSRLPAGTVAELERRCAAAGVRPVLI